MFDDLRIVELGGGVSAAFCAKLFADLGADVVKVEPPEGEVARRRRPFAADQPGLERSGLFAYLNTSKRGVTLDVASQRGRQILRELVRGADVLVENGPPGWLAPAELDFAHLRGVSPRLVMTSITPFGQDGPWRDYLGNDFVVFHTSGVAFNNGARVPDPAAQPPLVIPGYLAEFLGGLTGASATLCALFGQILEGPALDGEAPVGQPDGGQAVHVDVALQEALAMHLRVDITSVTYADRVPVRTSDATLPRALVGQQPTADGYVNFVVRLNKEWRGLLDVLGNPDWADNELFADVWRRGQYWDALEPLIQEETQRFTKDQLFRETQARGVAAAPVNTIADAALAGHFRDRGTFASFDHPVLGHVECPGALVRFGASPWRIRRPAPLLGEHNAEVLGQLGYTAEDVQALFEARVI